MAKIERFEDIEAWKLARELTRLVYEVTSSGSFAKDYDLRGQIRRASVSVMSNIAEGFERGGNKEFLQFLSTAKGSCGEVRSQLVRNYTPRLTKTTLHKNNLPLFHEKRLKRVEQSPAL